MARVVPPHRRNDVIRMKTHVTRATYGGSRNTLLSLFEVLYGDASVPTFTKPTRRRALGDNDSGAWSSSCTVKTGVLRDAMPWVIDRELVFHAESTDEHSAQTVAAAKALRWLEHQLPHDPEYLWTRFLSVVHMMLGGASMILLVVSLFAMMGTAHVWVAPVTFCAGVAAVVAAIALDNYASRYYLEVFRKDGVVHAAPPTEYE